MMLGLMDIYKKNVNGDPIMITYLSLAVDAYCLKYLLKIVGMDYRHLIVYGLML